MKKLYKYFILSLPAVLFLSNFPLLKLGETETMHLEVSLPELWLVLFALISLKNLKNLIRFYKTKTLAILSLFPLYATLSLLWTKNPLRGLLTVGLLWLVLFAALNIIYVIKNEKSAFPRRKIVFAVLIPSLVVSVFCWLQCFLDLAGLPRENSLLCLGCVSTTFGFPHPNGFAIEPQFMGNLLLAPTLLSFYLLSDTKKPQKTRILLFATAFFLSATLFLTFSRGAIYAFLAAAVLLACLLLRKPCRSLLTFPIIIISFVITLCVQGIFAELSPTSDTFSTGVTKAVHHLSLGLLDFRSVAEQPASVLAKNPAKPAQIAASDPVNPDYKPESRFSGYVPESTNVRLSFTNYAFDVWNDSPATLVFGSGLGSAGSVIFEKHPEISSPKEIVQNEYASLLLELGLAAYLILLFEIIYFAKLSINSHKSTKSTSVNKFILALIIAYAITLLFFSGLPNALHIYLLPPLLSVGLREVSKREMKPFYI